VSAGPAKLVVFMTLPIDPDMKTAWEQQRMLQRVKGAFLDGDTSAVVVSLIAEPLARFEEKHRMDSSDTQIVQVNASFALPQLTNHVLHRARNAASPLPHTRAPTDHIPSWIDLWHSWYSPSSVTCSASRIAFPPLPLPLTISHTSRMSCWAASSRRA
jgi:hypothetical protein